MRQVGGKGALAFQHDRLALAGVVERIGQGLNFAIHTRFKQRPRRILGDALGQPFKPPGQAAGQQINGQQRERAKQDRSDDRQQHQAFHPRFVVLHVISQDVAGAVVFTNDDVVFRRALINLMIPHLESG